MRRDWDKLRRQDRARIGPIDSFRPRDSRRRFDDTSTQLLRVERNGDTAGAVWNRRQHVWRCVRAAPVIQWMVGMNPKEARTRLAAGGWKFYWTRVTNTFIAKP